MAQQSKLWGRNGVKKICVVCVHTCLEPVFKYLGGCLFIRQECTECQVCEGSLAWMFYWNNAYLYTVHTDLFNHKGSAQSTVLQVALLAKQAFSRTWFFAKTGERLAWQKWWGILWIIWCGWPNCTYCNGCIPYLRSSNGNRFCLKLTFPSGLARHSQRLCCWCLQLQRSMQGWWAKRQSGFAPWTCPRP